MAAQGRRAALFLDGRLRVSGGDERALPRGAGRTRRWRRAARAGADPGRRRRPARCARCCATRTCARSTVVELDPGVVRLARTDPGAARAQRRRARRPAGAGGDRGRLQLAAGARPRRCGAGPTTSSSPTSPTPASPRAPSSTRRSSTGSRRGSLARDGRLVVHAGPPAQPAARRTGRWRRRCGRRACAPARTRVDGAAAVRRAARTASGAVRAGRPGCGLPRRAGPVRSSCWRRGTRPGWRSTHALPASRRGAWAGGVRGRARRAGLPPSTLTHPRYRLSGATRPGMCARTDGDRSAPWSTRCTFRFPSGLCGPHSPSTSASRAASARSAHGPRGVRSGSRQGHVREAPTEPGEGGPQRTRATSRTPPRQPPVSGAG